MSQKRLTEVGVTLLGLYCVIRGLDHLVIDIRFVSPLLFSASMLKSLFIQLLPALSAFVLAGVLLRHARTIATKLFGVEYHVITAERVPLRTWYIAAFSIAGVVLLLWDVFPHSLQGITRFLFPLPAETASLFGGQTALWWREVFGLAAVTIKACLAISLILGAARLADCISRLHAR